MWWRVKLKIVINRCYGGFSVTEDVVKELGFKWGGYGFLSNSDFGIEDSNYDKFRSDPRLIAAIEKIGLLESSGGCAELDIVEVPDGIDWYVDEYDGMESVHENHRSW